MRSSFSLHDFALLTKPRLVFSVVLTAITSYVLAYQTGAFDWQIVVLLIIGVYCTATAAHILNQIFELKNDLLMERTRLRPLPQKKLSKRNAYFLASMFLGVGCGALIFINLLTSLICLVTVIIYAYIYTPLKQIHFINTWVGAIPGSLPTVLGWSSINQIDNFKIIVFFLILFFWQICHFLALSWVHRKDYKNGQFKMLPLNDHSGFITSVMILLHGCVLLYLVSLFNQSFAFTFAIQLSLLIATIIFFIPMVIFLFHRSIFLARLIFFLSVTYLPVFFIIIYINYIVLV